MPMDSKRWTIERYSAGHAQEWDAFVAASRNGTFLLQRGYMDYHSDRFRDCSWMVRANGRLRAALPANITDDGVLHSHQGLTYGGWITPMGHLDGADMLEIFQTAAAVWRDAGIRMLDYKPVPYIYSRMAAQEDIYALFRMGGVMTGCGLSTAVNLSSADGIGLNQMQRRHLRDASRYEWTISEENDVAEFMSLLAQCLQVRHGVSPVHTPAEMQLLRDRFPENIRIFLLRSADSGCADAAVLIYDTGRVAHAQYIATTPAGRERNLLTPLFHRLMSDIFATREWFDFGISTEDNGRYLNAGLLRQKCSFGGSGVVYPRYELTLSPEVIS